jgi:protein-S-isoprenylcysteine O-methyltransferase Ste14
MAASLPLQIGERVQPRPPQITAAGLRHAAGNIAMAAMFFITALPNARHLDRGANVVWVVGVVMMGAMSIVRIAPRAVMMDARAFASTMAVLLLPCMVRPASPSMGMIAWSGIVLEILGVGLSQVARIYMGRSFGILPGNRGIVSKGPFRFVRHPIYAGWFLLTAGYLLSYPSRANLFIMIATLPFMMWRISLEEELLVDDPEYREYEARVTFRLIPGVF